VVWPTKHNPRSPARVSVPVLLVVLSTSYGLFALVGHYPHQLAISDVGLSIARGSLRAPASLSDVCGISQSFRLVIPHYWEDGHAYSPFRRSSSCIATPVTAQTCCVRHAAAFNLSHEFSPSPQHTKSNSSFTSTLRPSLSISYSHPFHRCFPHLLTSVSFGHSSSIGTKAHRLSPPHKLPIRFLRISRDETKVRGKTFK